MGEFTDDVGNAVNEVPCIVLLPQLTIYAACNGELRREGKLFCRNDDRSHGRKVVQAFSKVPLLVGRLDIPGRDIIQDGIAKDIVRGFFLAYIFAVLSDDDGKFTFVIKFADDIEMTVDGSIRIDAARDPFGKVDGHVPLLDLFFRVFLRQFLIVGGIVVPRQMMSLAGSVMGARILTLSMGTAATPMRLMASSSSKSL